MNSLSGTQNHGSEKWLKFLTVILGTLLLIVLCFVLKTLQSILIPFCISLFLVYLVEPLQRILIRFKLPVSIRVIFVLLTTAFLLYLVGILVFSSVKSLNNNLPQYEHRIIKIVNDVFQSSSIPSDDIEEFIQNFQWTDHFEAGSIAKVIGSSFGKFGGFLGNLFLMLLYMVYLLYERESFFKRIQKSFPTETAQQISTVIRQINLQIGGYLEIKTSLSLLTGGLVTGVLLIFGVEFAFFWGILTFLLNFIPSIGSVIATIPPIVISFLQFDSFVIPIAILLLLVLVQMIIGNIVEPKVMGKKLGLSPLMVILSLIFWGWLWGPVGMILSIPLLSAIRITCDNIEILQPISGFLAEES